MNIKAIDVVNLNSGLTVLQDKELDISTSFLIAKNIKELETVNTIISSKRDKLIQTYSQKDENGNIKYGEIEGTILLDDTEAFKKEFNALMNESIEIDLKMIPQTALTDIKLTPKTIMLLMPLLEE